MPKSSEFTEKVEIQIIHCNQCNRDFASKMKIPRCSKCGNYIQD